MNRPLRAAAAAIAAALSVAACAGGASPSPVPSAPGGSPQGTAAAPSSSAPAITLTVLEHQQLRADVLKELLPQFEQYMASKGQNVHVNLVTDILPDDQFKTKITLDYSTGNAPDVTSYPGSWVADFAASGYLLDLTDRVTAWPDWNQHFYPVIRERSVQSNGKIYSLPRGANTMELFYRKDVLQRYGVSTDQPTSWQDLIDRMIELKQKMNKPPILYPAGTAWGGGTFDEGFIHVFLGTGGKLYDDTTGKWIVKSQALTDAFTFYYNLTKNGLLPVQALLNPNPWQPTKYVAFPAGDLAVTTQGTWGWTYDWGPKGAAPIPDLFSKVATWAFPAESGPPFVWAAENWMWTISAKSAHPDEAFQLLQWLTSGEALAKDVVAVGSAAPRDDIQSIAPYSQAQYLIDAEKQLSAGKTFLPRPGIDKIQQAVGQATEDILLGKANGQQAADEFARLATQLLGPDKVTQ
jgi:multiple sugar transport system substrate-binding protein